MLPLPFPSSLPLVTTGEYLELYVGEGANWIVKSGPHWCDTPTLQAKESLLWLPLLEVDYPAVRAALLTGLAHAGPERAAQQVEAFPVQALLALALTSGCSVYWVNLALQWASHVGLAPGLILVVRALAMNPAVPQPIRHGAKRLYYTGKA